MNMCRRFDSSRYGGVGNGPWGATLLILLVLTLVITLSSCSTGGKPGTIAEKYGDAVVASIEACASDPVCVQAIKDEYGIGDDEAPSPDNPADPPVVDEPPVVEEPVEPVNPPVTGDPVVTGCAENHLPDNYEHTTGRRVAWTSDTCSADNLLTISTEGSPAPVAGMLTFNVTNMNADESYAERETFLVWIHALDASGKELNLHYLIWGETSSQTALVAQHFDRDPFFEKQSRHNGPQFDPAKTYRFDLQWTESAAYAQVWEVTDTGYTAVAFYSLDKPGPYSGIHLVRIGNGAYPSSHYPSLSTSPALENIRLSILE